MLNVFKIVEIRLCWWSCPVVNFQSIPFLNFYTVSGFYRLYLVKGFPVFSQVAKIKITFFYDCYSLSYDTLNFIKSWNFLALKKSSKFSLNSKSVEFGHRRMELGSLTVYLYILIAYILFCYSSVYSWKKIDYVLLKSALVW